MTRLAVVCCTLLLISGCSAGDDAFKRDLADSFRRIADVVEEELRRPPVKPPVEPQEPSVAPIIERNLGGPIDPLDGPSYQPPITLVGEPLADTAGQEPGDTANSKLTPPPPPCPGCPSPTSPTYWETDEYMESRGLRLINASAGYAIRESGTQVGKFIFPTGQPGGFGITVAVIDDGVDLSHRDMASLGLSQEYSIEGDELLRSHGTQVAGVIAARKNGVGMHGVAYNAQIMSIANCGNLDSCEKSEKHPVNDNLFGAVALASAAGSDQNIFTRFRANPDASSDIINMSFAYLGDHYVYSIVYGMEVAAAAGRIMVAALGNEGEAGPAGSPASNVAEQDIAGYAIAVGSLNADGTGKADHSNTCGAVAEYCMFAPGENILTTKEGGDYTLVSGTSLAAPHVSGAAAVVWAAFRKKTGDEIVQRLLTTANRSGVFGNSAIFGQGALDLGTALAPIINRARGLTVGGSMVPLADSYVALPPGFSAPARSHALANTIVYDAMMFPFYYDLAASFRVSDRSAEGMLRDFLSQLGKSSNVSLGGADANLHFVHDDDMAEARWGTLEGDDRDEELDVYRFSLTPAPGVRVTVGQGFGSIGSSNDFIADRTNRTIFGDAFSVAPFAAFAGRGPGLTVSWQVDHGTTIDLVGKDGRGYSGSSNVQLASLGLTREIADGVTLGTRYGTLREKGSLMGIRTAGAFANADYATTDFVDVSMEGRASDGLTLFGSVSQGITGGGTRGAKNSLVSEWSDTRAGSFVIGTEFEHFLQDSDRLTVTVSSPFRADRATIHMDVPDREVADTIVGYTRRAIDLVPGGREYRIQWVYEMRPDASWLGFGRDAVSAAVGSYVRMEAHHDETADPEFGAAAKIRASF